MVRALQKRRLELPEVAEGLAFSQAVSTQLTRAWQDAEFPLSEPQKEDLAKFLALINQWNRVHSLTAIEGLEEQVTKHLLDALGGWPLIEKAFGRQPAISVADVGSGMGVPGIVWALVMPQSRFDLIERQQKKAAFLTHVVGRLGLVGRVRVVGKDVQHLQPTQPYDLITSRAFAALGDFVRLTWNLSSPQTKWAAMVGKINKNGNLNNSEHSQTLPKGAQIEKIEVVIVPGLEAERHMTWIGRQD
jgi:16S rRNA (guanine527-N7)-methyltransferase